MKAEKEPFDYQAKKTPQRINLHWESNELGSYEASNAFTLRVSIPPDPTRSEPLAFVKKKRTRWHWQRYDVAKVQGRCKKSGVAASRNGAMDAAVRALDDWLELLRYQAIDFPKPLKRDSPPQRKVGNDNKPTNSDDGFTIDYSEVISSEKQAKIHTLLSGTDRSSVDRFIGVVQYPVSACRAHLKAHGTIPDAKDQKRYLTKLENKSRRLLKLTTEVSELLEKAPFELRKCATRAGSPFQDVQANLTAMMLAINDITPAKSKHRPEIEKAVKDIASAYRKELHAEPIARAVHEASDSVGDRFVPVLVELLNVSMDHAYRLARKNLPS